MSVQLFQEDVVFSQRMLKCSGLYGGVLDGIWTRETDKAMTAFEAECDVIAQQFGHFDRRSERCIRSLLPCAQRAARAFLRKVNDSGIQARIISGSRTYLEQEALYGRGRYGNPGPVVTNARGGQSNHNFGIAWDIAIFDGGRYVSDSAQYDEAAAIGLSSQLEWGGNWDNFRDAPHYQLALPMSLVSARVNFEAGLTFL